MVVSLHPVKVVKISTPNRGAGYEIEGDRFVRITQPNVMAAYDVLTELPPLVKWAAAIIAGGGIAGLTQSLTTVVRAKSTMMTGTVGNPAVATAELGGSLAVSLLALIAPLLTALVIVVLLWLAIRWVRRVSRQQPTKS